MNSPHRGIKFTATRYRRQQLHTFREFEEASLFYSLVTWQRLKVATNRKQLTEYKQVAGRARCMMSTYIMCHNSKAYLADLKEKWQQLHSTPTVFAYSLNVSLRKYLAGQLRFYAELNSERATQRRAPQTIPCLDPQFEPNNFNFTKIKPMEIISSIPYESIQVSLIINRSPLTHFHTLICPDVAAHQPQRITQNGLAFSVSLLRSIDDNTFRIGYNSPGAMASVNHLHLHLIHIDLDLYIDTVKLQKLAGKHIYRLTPEMATQAVCFLIFQTDSDTEVKSTLRQLYQFLVWLCDQNMPHNIFMTPSRDDEVDGVIGPLKIFVYARETYSYNKDLTILNLGFCELSGFWPIGDADLFDTITEEQLLQKIHEESGAVYQHIYNYFTK